MAGRRGGRSAAVLVAAAVACAALVAAPPGAPLAPAPAAAAVNTCPAPRSTVLTTVPATVARNVALTFDDGPSPKWTTQVLDILAANGVRATFFMTGRYARAYPALVHRAVAEGHTVGNHSYSHPKMTSLTRTAQAAQLDAATKYISAAVPGGYRPCFFRPPYGAYSSTTTSLARSRGMSTTMWSRDTRDWTTPLHLSSSFQRSIVSRATSPVSAHPNVLLHDGSPGNYRQNTVDSVQRIITYYQDRGYRFTDPAGR